MSSCIHRLFRHIAALKRSFRGGVSILLTPAHETQPRQNPVLLVSSRAGKGSQSFSSHLGRYNHLETILPRNEQGSDRDISRYVVPSNAADSRPRNEKNAAFEYPLAGRPLRRIHYGRCARKAMRKKNAAENRDGFTPRQPPTCEIRHALRHSATPNLPVSPQSIPRQIAAWQFRQTFAAKEKTRRSGV